MAVEAPSFFLYGEPPRPVEAGFLHLEPLDARSRPNGWSIRLHQHSELNHLFLMTSGLGAIQAADRRLPFSAPCLLLIPAGMAHGFDFRRESTGQVLTIASSFLQGRAACAEVVGSLFDAPHVLECGEAADALQRSFAELARELAWRAPGHQAAVEAAILQAFVAALRLLHQKRAAEKGETGRDEALLARFREAVEARFREHPPLQAYAQALGVSLSRLHQACRRATDATPLEVIQERVLLEAKRGLLYSDTSISELALHLGFADPAYFSRFFARHAGVSARRYRQARSAV